MTQVLMENQESASGIHPLHQSFVLMVLVQSFVFCWKHLGYVSTFLSSSLYSCDISLPTFVSMWV